MNPFIGEIKMYGGSFAPAGWAFCDGQLLPIRLYMPLFSLIVTTYGGDGVTTFALPNLQSRFPVHMGSIAGRTFTLGEMFGAETVPLNVNQIPAHTHPVQAGVNGEYNAPAGHVWASWPGGQYTNSLTGLQAAAAGNLGPAGGSQPHENMPPFLVVNFIIALEGIYPSQT